MNASFNEDGSLISLDFKSEAQAERAALATQESANALIDLMKIRSDAIKARAAADDAARKKELTDEIADIDHQILIANRERDLREAGQPTKDALDREQETLRKKIELRKLEIEFESLGGGASE